MAPPGNDDPTATAEVARDGKPNKVSDYLQAPRRKRRNYVVSALSKRAREEFGAGIDGFIRANVKGVSSFVALSMEELVKSFRRQIVLFVYDDEFAPFDEGLRLVEDLKAKKNGDGVPVLFLTRQPDRLISHYRKTLAAYQEIDDYIDLNYAELRHVISKVRSGLAARARRRSRRYRVDLPIRYYLLDDDKYHAGRILDLSIHGALIKAEDGSMFRLGQQLKVSIQLADKLSMEHGEYLKIAARVRRVFIGGSQVGVSFEHVSASQLKTVTAFVLALIGSQIERRSASNQNKGAQPKR